MGSPLAIENAAIQGLGLAMMGRAEEGEQLLMDLLATLPSGAQRQRAEMSLGWVYLATDRVELARHELSSASSTDFSDGSLRISLWARAWSARAEFLMGDWDQALETVRSAQALQERSEIQILRPLIQMTAAQIHALRGNWEQADLHLRKSWARTGSYAIMEMPYRMARAEIRGPRSPGRRPTMKRPCVRWSRCYGWTAPRVLTRQASGPGRIHMPWRSYVVNALMRPTISSSHYWRAPSLQATKAEPSAS